MRSLACCPVVSKKHIANTLGIDLFHSETNSAACFKANMVLLPTPRSSDFRSRDVRQVVLQGGNPTIKAREEIIISESHCMYTHCRLAKQALLALPYDLNGVHLTSPTWDEEFKTTYVLQ